MRRLRRMTETIKKKTMTGMKKSHAMALAALMIAASLAGCAKESADDNAVDQSADDTDRINIVTTIFPEYDWVREIIGDTDSAEITLLLANGVDLHSYQPTAEDMIKVSSCDLFVYVGGESDEWVEDALEEATNDEMVVVNLFDVLGDAVKAEELAEGMQESEHVHDHDEDHDHDSEDPEEHAEEHEDAHSGEEEEELDEHVWLSLKNAKIICSYLADQLGALDAEHADDYHSNAEEYIARLDALDAEYQSAVSSAANDVVLFGDRFPFRYLTDDYGLTYYAAFAGCSAETEASFETITFLARKADECELPAVLTIDNSDQKIARTIVSNTKSKNQKILVMDSLQSVTSDDAENGTTYLSVMEENLEVLKEALQ